MQLTNLRKTALAATLMAGGLMVTVSCKKSSSDPDALTLTSAKIGSTEIAAATPPTGVSLTDNIVMTFSTGLNASTVTASTVMLKRGTKTLTGKLTTSGSTVTLDPDSNLLSGSTYVLMLTNGIKSGDGATYAGNGAGYTFQTSGPVTVTAEDFARLSVQNGFWAFNNSASEAQGRFATGYAQNTYVADRHGNAASAAQFNGVSDLIEITNGSALITNEGSVSFWMKLDTTRRYRPNGSGGQDLIGHFPMGANFFNGFEIEVGALGERIVQAGAFKAPRDTNSTVDTTADNLPWNGKKNGWQGVSYNDTSTGEAGVKAMLGNTWAHVVTTYEASSKRWTMYVNGVKRSQYNLNQWPAGDAKLRVTGRTVKTYAPAFSTTFAFGFAKGRDASFWEDPSTVFGQIMVPAGNHFHGALDDVRFFTAPLTDADVSSLYALEK